MAIRLSKIFIGTPANPPIICCAHKSSVGGLITGIGPSGISNLALTANQAVFIPFILEYPAIVQGIAVFNGAAVAGNLDGGIYDRAGNRLVSSGSTVQAGIGTIQTLVLAATALKAGQYFMALCSSSTGNISQLSSNVASPIAAFGLQQMAAAFPLPATATFANFTATLVPIFAVMLVGTI